MKAIQKIKPPKSHRELQTFIGMVNYYRDIWPQKSHILAPLTSLTLSAVKWEWTSQHQKAFDEMKWVITRETLLAYPDFSKPFDIHTDAIALQLGACISQEG